MASAAKAASLPVLSPIERELDVVQPLSPGAEVSAEPGAAPPSGVGAAPPSGAGTLASLASVPASITGAAHAVSAPAGSSPAVRAVPGAHATHTFVATCSSAPHAMVSLKTVPPFAALPAALLIP